MRVEDLGKENAVDTQLDVVLRDGYLAVHLDCLLAQVVNVLDGVDEGNTEIEAWLELLVELPHSVEHECVLFRHNDDAAEEIAVDLANTGGQLLLGVKLQGGERSLSGQHRSDDRLAS